MFSKRRSLFILCLSLLLALTLAATAFAQPADIKGHWAEKQINNWVDNGLINGYPDGSFKPDNSVTRAEFVVLANKACGYTASAPATFTDVKPTDWYYGEVAKAVAAGYISGYTDGTFKPDGKITRQEATVIIARILGLDTTGTSALGGFKDAEEFPAWSRGSINAVVAKGYMMGYPDQTFQAAKSITRAEAVVTLDNSVIAGKVIAATYDEAGVYGPAAGTDTIAGDAVISAAGVTLQNTLITGNLLLAEGIGSGDVILKNVTVKGNTTIKGGGANSVNLENCVLNSVTVNKEKVRIAALGSTTVNTVTLESGATLVGDGFKTVTVSTAAGVVLDGNFDVVAVKTRDAKIEIAAGIVKSLTLDARASVTGAGKIGVLSINVSGSTVAQTPAEIKTATGVTATVGGKTVGTAASSGGGGGGGGGTPVTPTVGAITITTDPADVSGLPHDAGPVTVTLSTATDGADVYYTTNGTAPTASSTLYKAAFAVNNPYGLAGGTVTIKAIGIKSGYSNSAVSERNIVYHSAETATVYTSEEFKTALECDTVGTIALGKNISGNVTATRAGAKDFTVDFGAYALSGDLKITADNVKEITLNGTAVPAITGNLEIAAESATVKNYITVGGGITVTNVGSSSWIEYADGNKIIITDDNGATIIIEGNPDDITIEEGAGGGINITANSPVSITVSAGATVESITANANAAGTSITNNGTVGTVTANAPGTSVTNNGTVANVAANAGGTSITNSAGATIGNVDVDPDADVDIRNDNADNDINVSGSGTVGVSGAGADNIKTEETIIRVKGISSDLGISAVLRIGATTAATITGVTAGEGETLNVTSANPEIVSVDTPAGLAVTAHKSGKAVVTVQVKDIDGNITAQGTIVVTVLPAEIAAASVTMTAPVTMAAPQTAAQVEAATGAADYTVTSVAWNEDLTPDGKFKADQVYTATVVLTSKNNKAFQQEAFTPAVAGSASVGQTKTSGTGVGNRVSFTVTFPATAPAVVTGISIKTAPVKVTYTAGEALDLSGLAVTLNKSDNSKEDVALAEFAAKGITAAPANGTVLKTTDTKITLTHTASGKSVEQAITVTPSAVTGIGIKTPPAKVTYTAGEALDLTGLAVTLTRSDKSTEDVALADFAAKGITAAPANGTVLKTTDTKVTLTHTTSGKSVDQAITVTPSVTGISVKTAPAKTTYTEGEALNLTGLAVTLTKPDSSTEDVALADFAAKGITTTPVNGATLATTDTKVTITHTASGKSAEQPITVKAAQPPATVTVTGISIKTGPTKTNYTECEALDLTGLAVTLTRSNGSKEDVALADFVAKGITTTPANGTYLETTELKTTDTEVTITHAASGKSAKQTITVEPPRAKLSVSSTASGKIKVSVDSNYAVKAVIPKGAEVDLSDVTVELTRIYSGSSITVSKTMALSNIDNLSLDNFVNKVNESGTSGMVVAISEAGTEYSVTYTLDSPIITTDSNNILIIRPDDTGNARDVWQNHLKNALKLTFSEGSPNKGQVYIPDGTDLEVGDKQLHFDGPLTLEGITNNFDVAVDNIKAAASVKGRTPASGDPQIKLSLPIGAKLVVGEGQIESKKAIKVTINGLGDSLLNSILKKVEKIWNDI